MAELGFEVLGIDTDAARVAALNDGALPFYEPDLEPLLRKHRESGRLRFTTSYTEIAEFADLHFVCVGTPQRHDSLAADMRYLDSAVESLAPLLTRPATVVGKSTVPVGTAARVAERFADVAPAGPDVDVVWNPEFLREGFAVEDTLRPDRIVIGLAHPRAEQVMRAVYADALAADVPMVVTDYPTAELVKVAANSFLATKISFINAMAEVCEATGADVTELADAIGYDPRIGRRFLHAGLGFGGGCLPKDIRAFMARAGELGVETSLRFLEEVDAINARRRGRMVDLVRESLQGSLAGARVGILGAAFKPDSDDIRDSPALDVAARLHQAGAEVRVYDPKAIPNARVTYPDLTYADSTLDACREADVTLLLTEWREFRDIDPDALGAVVRQRHLVDGRNVLDPIRWRHAGWTYRALGRPDS